MTLPMIFDSHIGPRIVAHGAGEATVEVAVMVAMAATAVKVVKVARRPNPTMGVRMVPVPRPGP
jgi:hypothetical protein